MNRINNKFFLYNLIPLNIVFDILSFWASNRGWFGILRAVFLISILGIFYVKKDFPRNRASTIIVVFSVYIIFLFPFVTNLAESLRISFQIILALFFYTVGYKLIKSFKDLRKINKSIFYSILLLIFNFALSNVFNLGNYKYGEQSSNLFLGNYRDAVNIFVYILFILPIIFFDVKKNRRILLYTFAIFLLSIILLSTKRIAVLGTVVGLFIFLYQIRDFLAKSLMRVLIILILFISVSPFFMDAFKERWQSRAEAGRLEADSYETEARYLETLVVWQETFSFKDIPKSFFGMEAFNSPGLYGGGSFGRRQLHVDYNLILSTTGIIGLLLYLSIYFNIYKNYIYHRKNFVFQSMYGNILNALFFMLFFGSLVTSIAGQMYGISFRGLIFLYLGGLTGLLKNMSKQKSIQSESINSL